MNQKLVYAMVVICGLQVGLSTSAWAQEKMSDNITIENAVMCQNVVNRVPIGTADVFSKDIGKVFCFCKVLGASPPSQITFNWYYQGSLKSTVTLPVKSASWRTWSFKNITPEMTGEWMVEILTKDDKPLDSIIFFIQ